ncbi:MAG TPA: Ig-like domain-containing protein, partial [Steroidobacteraceae bacterium]|nr:Ig-like domain-containing protein [Steroidobacteraceae bacterium]
MRTLTLAAITLAAFSMSGCFSDSASSGGDSGGGVTPPPSQATFKPLFAPLGGILPYPTDLFFNGSTDGTLNIPLLAANPTAAAMNELDGFSIIAPITVRFSDPIDPATINQSTVKVFEVVADPALGFATVGFKAPLLLGVDYSAQVAPNIDAGGSTLRITPLKPLNGKSAYLVVLTNGLKSTTGVAATPDSDYAAILAALPSCDAITNTSLNGICRLVGANVAIASNPALGPLATAPQDIVLTFSFSTQSIADVPSVIGQLAQARPNFVNPIPVGTTQTFIGPASPGAANIHVGTIDMPYYVAPSEALTGRLEAAGPPPAPLDQSSRAVTRYNPVLAQKATVTMPMIIAVPRLCGPMPEAGWPLVLYNIGLVVSRTTLIATADALTAPPVCHAAVAIDLPLHGITDPANPLFASPQNPLYQSDTVVEP